MPSAEELLRSSRERLKRLSPSEAARARDAGALLVDIRPSEQRESGVVPGSVAVPRNVLEWRFDPASEHRDPELARTDRQVVVLCQHGYQSSLVAATLQGLGHADATDLDGGFEAWESAGLPVGRSSAG